MLRDRVFVSYSHSDKEWLNRLREVVAPDKRNDRIDYWDDGEIEPGDSWFNRIIDGIASARLAVLLVSPSFLRSRFIMEEELPRILRAVEDGLTVIWVPLTGTFCGPDAPGQLKTIARFQAACDPAKPLAERDAQAQNEVLLEVGHRIQLLLNPRRVPGNLRFTSLGSLFKGRDQDLARLDAHLRKNGSAAIVQPQTISGLGGIGKTRLALEYAWRHQNDFGAFLFVSANTPDDLAANLARLSAPDILDLAEYKLANQDDQHAAVIRWLQQNKGWLLIIDNVDTPEAVAAVQNLVAKLAGGHVLITSRITQWGRGIQRLSLEVIPVDDAVALLLEATRGQAAASPEDSCHAQALAERLGCLPLALTHAVAYLGYYEIKIGEYLAEFDRNLSDVLRYHDHKAIQYETNPEKESRVKTVATTFFMSFDRLDSVEKAILQAASFLAPDPIPVAMFGECPEQLNKLVHLWCQENGEQAVGKPVRDAVAQLANFSLITRADGTFSMHRMEQAILRNRVPASVKYKWSEATVNLLRGYAPTNPRHPSAWSAWEPLLPHAEFLWNAYRATPGLTISVQLPAAIAQFFLGKGRYKNAIPYARQVLDYHELHSGPEHPDTFISRSTLADLMRRNGEYKAAEPMQRQALEMSERVLGREHTSTLECIHALGILLSYKREYAEAEPLLRRVLEVRERVLGPEHPDTVDSVNELAVMLYKAGRFVEVDPLFRRALEASERVLGPDHPNTLDNLNNLARLRDDQGDYGAADSLFRRALEASERVLGPEHPSTLLYLRNYRLFAAAPLIYVGVLLYNLILPTWRYFDKLADPKRLLVFLIAIALGFAMAIAIRRSSRRSIWGVPTEVLVVGVVFLTAFQIIPRISQAAASANWLSTWFALGCGWGLTITWVQRIRAGLLFRAVLHAFRKRQRQ